MRKHGETQEKVVGKDVEVVARSLVQGEPREWRGGGRVCSCSAGPEEHGLNEGGRRRPT